MEQYPEIQNLLDQATQAAQKKQLPRARQLLSQVLEAHPDNLRALDLAGFVYFFDGQYAQAEGFCRRALAVAPDHAYAHKGLGLCLSRQDRLAEGLEELERAIAIKPNWADPYWDMAVVLSEKNKLDEALAVLARAKDALPPSSVARFMAFSERLKRQKS